MLSPQSLRTVSAAAAIGATSVVSRPPGTVTTAISDLELASQSGQSVSFLSTAGEIPTVNVGDLIAIEDHSTAGNNGVYKVVAVVTAGEDVDVVKITAGAPANAAAEAATALTNIGWRPVIPWFHLATATVAGTASLVLGTRTVATTGATGAPVTSVTHGGPVVGDAGESIKLVSAVEAAVGYLTFGWIQA
jgi:hypothetical protein